MTTYRFASLYDEDALSEKLNESAGALMLVFEQTDIFRPSEFRVKCAGTLH
jgi:hypothetical protein